MKTTLITYPIPQARRRVQAPRAVRALAVLEEPKPAVDAEPGEAPALKRDGLAADRMGVR